MNDLPTTKELCREIRKELDREYFRADPDQIWIIIAHTLLVLICLYTTRQVESLWLCAALGVVMGHSIFCLANMCHNLSHQTIIRNRTACYLAEAFFWGVALHSATVWTKTHNGTHHRYTNTKGDTFRRFTPDERRLDRTIMHTLFFPNRYFKWNPLAFFSYIILYKTFELTALLGLPYNASWMGPLSCKYNWRERLRVFVEVAWVYGLQCLFFLYLGGTKYVVTIVLAYMVANFIVTLYVHSQHGTMPLTRHNSNPLENTVNVKVSAFSNWLHSNVALHIEHHLFPTLNYKYAPVVSKLLKERYGAYYRERPMLSVWSDLFNAPLYRPVSNGDDTSQSTSNPVGKVAEQGDESVS
jgi:fatty acid desaturase